MIKFMIGKISGENQFWFIGQPYISRYFQERSLVREGDITHPE